MSSTRFSAADESNPSATVTRTSSLPAVSPDSDSELEDIDEVNPVLETIPRRGSHSRRFIQYISGGRGGSGGSVGAHGSGGAGGPGEGPTLQYDIRAARLTMQTYKTTTTRPSGMQANIHGSTRLSNNRLSAGRPPVTTRRRSPSPVPRYRQNQQLSRPRSHSPQRDHIAKRLRVEEPNAFIAFGPLADSVETPQKLFELHLRTAIPQFRLEAPYVVELDPGFAAHVRITVKSAPVARALMDAWATQNVAGYAKIKMVAMTSASGQEAARGGIARHQFIHRADNQDGVKPTSSNHYKYNLLNVICWNVLKSNTLISLVVKLPRKLNMSRCGSLHAFCKGKTYDKPLVNWWTLRIFTWEERTLPAHQL
ncbi:hypothetical protein C8R45DRAFT_1180965 [Mycena sanguinolenta]|nr:hypothetical protein C8R45DRAFT_1180965 [Mycena sanguinolenta]